MHRVLICRTSAIGDVILTMPVACALRDGLPDARIAWFVEEAAAPLLAGHRAIDELLVVKKGWLQSLRAVRDVRRRLRAFAPSISVDCQSLTKSAAAAWLSGAKQRIGCRGKYGAELSPWLNNLLIEPRSPHIVDRSLELLRPLGIESPAARFDLPIDAAAKATVRAFLREADLASDYAVVNPGAGWDSKLWPADRFAEVAQHLGRRHGLPSLVVWAGEREFDWAKQIVAEVKPFAALAPRTSLVELAAVMHGARLFVGSDTGPLHMAAATGAPCVGLYGPTRPEDCGPYGPKSIALQAQYQSGGSRARRGADNSAMRAISVETVCAACDELLSRENRTAA